VSPEGPQSRWSPSGELRPCRPCRWPLTGKIVDTPHGLRQVRHYMLDPPGLFAPPVLEGGPTRGFAAQALAVLVPAAKPTARTLGEYALGWLPRRERSDKGLKATTLSEYRRYIEADIEPSALGGMKLTNIRRYHVATFAADLTKAGRGHRTADLDATGNHLRQCCQR
jgi:hypothetical protein